MNTRQKIRLRDRTLITACACYLSASIAPPVMAQVTHVEPLDDEPKTTQPTGDPACGNWQPAQLSSAPSGQLAVPSGNHKVLQSAERDAQAAALAANNMAATTMAAFTNETSVSIQTGSNLAAVTYAAGVQEFLIDFGSALADLASISDFLEGVTKGDMSEKSLLQNLDSIYEAAKTGEGLANNLADQIIPAPEGTSTSPINDAFGAMGVADEYWGTDGLTNINSLKSDYSDIANLIEDYRKSKDIKKLNPRTLGQLIFRVAKGHAENDLKERKQQIADLQRDLAAEQCASGGLARSAQMANEAKWQAMDRLAAIRQAELEQIRADPASLAATAQTTGPGIDAVTTDCPSCQPLADRINRARAALRETGVRIAAIEASQVALADKKARLQALKNDLAGFDRVTAGARDGLRSTDVPVLGSSQEIQNAINLREMDRRNKLTQITRLQDEIAIEEGNATELLEALHSARSALLAEIPSLRAKLANCEAACPNDRILGSDLAKVFGGVFGIGETDLPQAGIGFVRDGAYGTAPDDYAVLTRAHGALYSWSAVFDVSGGFQVDGGVTNASSAGQFDIAPGGGVDSGIVYGGLSPSGSSGIATPFGLSGTASVDYSSWHIGGGYTALKTENYDLRFYADYSQDKLDYTANAWGAGDNYGFTYEFGQSRDQKVQDKRFETGVSGTYRFAPMSTVSPYVGLDAGLYYQSTTLQSMEYNSSNFGPSADQNFTLQFDDNDKSLGFHGRAEAGIEFAVAPTWSLVMGAAADYRSKVGGVWNPYSGDQVYYDGMTTTLVSENRWSWYGFAGLRLRY